MQEIGKKQGSHTDFFLAMLVALVIIGGVAWWWLGLWPFKGQYVLDAARSGTPGTGTPAATPAGSK